MLGNEGEWVGMGGNGRGCVELVGNCKELLGMVGNGQE